ncbi:4'-phosphopantetheinyl transferase superfamily protein [Arthrobacter sp. U41]|uniref:4'-phosphopantetheinyl transferase family protein n=1 Tax=Arthrobacter sp. U41 TaxID=1849032 RepID=UPI0011A8BC08|nr:4'-phosphopantetheinyl transferase family protein [Arthrobacter sp. U41]
MRLADAGPDGETHLDPAEQARAAGITAPVARRDFLAGRIALRAFAAGILGVRPGELTADYSCPDCGTGPELDHGRPGYRLHGAPAGLILSLSRSRGWALLAAGRAGAARETGTAGMTIGVDLEHSAGVMFPEFDDVALTAAERQLLVALPPEKAIPWRASAWARKEALLKAHGTGLRIDPASVEAFAESADGTVVLDLDTVALGLPAGFAAALAIVEMA